jgi:predicted nucleotidyltransferase
MTPLSARFGGVPSLADSVDWSALLANLDHHGCHTWILYGSLARGDHHPTSDIDLLWHQGRR